MQYLKWIAGGAVGAVIGGTVWVIASIVVNGHLPFMIALVGILAGIGVRRMARDSMAQWAPAALAMALTLAVGALAKYGAVSANFVSEHQEFWDSTAGNSLDDEAMISMLADEVVLERQAKNETIHWPDSKMTYEDAAFPSDYPAAIWAEGQQRWDALPPDEQAERREDRERQVSAIIHQYKAPERESAFRASVGTWDIVWFAAALIGAFWIGGRFGE